MAVQKPRDDAHRRYAIKNSEPSAVRKMAASGEAEDFDSGSNKEYEDNLSNPSSFYEKVFVGKSGAWTAASTVAMCIFSFLLWRVSVAANQNNIATQRATLSAQGPTWSKVLSPDGKLVQGYAVTYAIFNGGSMPASSGSAQVNLSVGPEHPGERDFSKLPQAQTVSFVLGPKGFLGLNPVQITLSDMEDVSTQRKHLFLWGWAVYRDGFSGTPVRLSEFCTDVTGVTFTNPNHSSPLGDIQLTTPPCEKHNCYDEDCQDYKARTQ